MTAFDSSKTTVSRSSAPATPTPRPEVTSSSSTASSTLSANATSSGASDATTLSQETKEAAGAQSTPVNFSSWDAPSDGSTAAATPAGGVAAASTDVSALGSGLLKRGASGEEVEALQKLLNERTGSSLEVDGKFGKDTLRVLKEFQESQGLKADGIVGKDTRGAFSQLASGAAAQGAAEAGAEASAPAAGGGQGAAEQVEGAEQAAPAGEAEQATPAQAAEAAEQAAAAAQAQGAAEAQGTEATSAIPGTEDTSWTESLPAGLKPHAEAFIEAGKKYGIDPRFLAAVSMQETGNGTSYSMRNRNNAMGIMNGSKHRSFNSVADSINSQAHSLTRENGYYTGKTTIAEIGATYAPVGAKNDPNNLNRHWVPNISRNFEMLGGDPSGQVKGFDVAG